MSLTQIFPHAQALTVIDKIRLMQFLSKELETDIRKVEHYWIVGALRESGEAAAILEQALKEDRLKYPPPPRSE